MNFNSFIGDIERNSWNVHGVEVYKDTELVHSWGDTGTKYPIYSATKTVLSIAVGIARDRGQIDLNRFFLDYMPENALRKLSGDKLSQFGCITLHRLMTMSVDGFPFRPEGDSWLDFSLACSIGDPESQVFCYSNIPAYLTGVALTCALGEDVTGFIKREIFLPLGITGAESSRCPDGYFYGASGMKLSVNDLSRIGLLLANGGVYAGQHIISEKYVNEATSALQPNREDGYGYFIWKYKNGFSINGKWGQKCYMLPERGLMVTYLAHMETGSHVLKESMEKHIFCM